MSASPSDPSPAAERLRAQARAWWLRLQPTATSVDARERWRATLGALLGIAFTGLLSRWGLGERLRAFVSPSRRTHSDRHEVVGQIMTRQVRVASAARHIVELAPIFTEGGHHHIPIVEADNRLVGIVTQSDFVRAL